MVYLIPRGVEGGRWRVVGCRYVKVDLIPSGVEDVGWGGVQVCEGRLDS